MKTLESEETYLETILILNREKGGVRSVDVAEKLGYAKSSVSRAVNLLIKKGCIYFGKDNEIYFTDEGRRRAVGIWERHSVLTDFLMEAGAPREVAEADACRIEHVISPELFEIVKNGQKRR